MNTLLPQRKPLFVFVIFSFFLSIVSAKPMVIELDHQPSGKNGDIVQLWASKREYTNEEDNILRNALKRDAYNKWDKNKGSKGHYIIPYVMTGMFDNAQKKIIQKTMRKISTNSCLKFQQRSSVKGKHRNDYVDIQNRRGEGCYTTVGRFSGRNVLMLETNQMATCLVPATVIHELLHVVGLWHEQMRYDRDKYIKIHYENIIGGTASQFEKVPKYASSTYGVKYDYKSVMHYKKDAFSKGGVTMETRKKSFQNVIGSVSDASKRDYMKICSIYNCAKCMGKPFDKNKKKSSKKRKSRTEGQLNLDTVLRDAPLIKLEENNHLESSDSTNFSIDSNSELKSGESSEYTPLDAPTSESSSIESIEGDSQESGARKESILEEEVKIFEISREMENNF